MEQGINTIVKQAIQDFLKEQLNKKIEPELKALEKAKLANDQQAIDKRQETINQLTDKYTFDNWMDDAANRMAKQLKFGTHIAKGVHPDSKGDNINFKPQAELPDTLIGSHSLTHLELDASGNAAALPLASFFNINIGGYKLRDLIIAEHKELAGCFAQDEIQSAQYQAQFKAALDKVITTPSTSGLNKQLLWPNHSVQSIKDNEYTCLIPLYPSSLTHHLHRSINNARFSEENKQARENRKKKNVEQEAYLSIHDLAYVKLGGGKPRNVGQLNHSQGGRNYLLPSFPPQITNDNQYKISKYQTTFFNNSLKYHCRVAFEALLAVLESKRNVVDIREQRKRALDEILTTICLIAQSIQQQYSAGWTKDSKLPLAQKLWLDPRRGDLEGEEEFQTNRQQIDWQDNIARSFSLWINHILQQAFPDLADDLNDPEVVEWRKTIKATIKASQRRQEEIF